jgi:CRISPR-associated endonuclease/helicase Cas3/CRISPR-associated endonuclease Cas3-HD
VTLDADDPNWPGLLSHPADDGRDAMVLERHLLIVASRARGATPARSETADGKSLRDAAEIVGLAHDFGKATTMFQTHIGNDTGDEEPSHHARLGGLLAYYALSRRGYGPRSCFAGLVAVAKHHGTLPNADSFVSTGLEQATTWEGWKTDASAYNGHTIEQAENVETNRPAFARAVVDRLVKDEGSWSEFLSLLSASTPDADGEGESLRDRLRETFMLKERRWHPDNRLFDDGATYLDELRLYGALTFADKTHAAGITENDERLHANPLETAQVRDHIEQLGDDHEEPNALETHLNTVRSAVQEYVGGQRDVDPVADFLDSSASVATLTLPTGYGKTLTGLLAAARIREATGGDRIVYALPFTSVIDQTADVLRELLRGGPEDSDPSKDRRLTDHHHLTEALTLPRDHDGETGEEPTDEESDRAVMLAESWLAGVTLTTFVQLFESLAGPRNTQSMKLPALYGSVVVVDEPQALPLTWWPLVERLIGALVEEYGATVVLMTATQPRIVNDERTFSLLDTDTLDTLERETASELPDRVEYDFHPTALATGDDESAVVDYDDAAASLVGSVMGTTESALTICNTIDSTGDLFDAVTTELGHRSAASDPTDEGLVDIASRFEDEVIDDGRFGVPSMDGPERHRAAFVRALSEAADEETPAVLYLSTRLRPCDRRFLLTVTKELTEESIPLLVVSTQLVEAGVDVSFDRVFRDFAPLDSIVQAAGRCNRSFEREQDAGEVFVWRLDAPEALETIPSEVVYARRESPTDTDLLAKTREALGDVPTGEPVSESDIADRAVGEYHDLVGSAVEAMADDNDLYKQFQQANGDELRKASLIDSPFSFEVYVCRSEKESGIVEEYRKAEKEHQFKQMRQSRQNLAEIRVSVPAYRRDSDTTRKLVGLTPLSFDAEKADATERILLPETDESFFDIQKGVDVPESTVDRRIL